MYKNKRESVITKNLDDCYICKSRASEMHHIFFGGNMKKSYRLKSEYYGLKLPLCRNCHNKAHNDREFNYRLRRIGQRCFEKKIGTREEFMAIFEKNYL